MCTRIPRVVPLVVDPEALFAAGGAVEAAGGGLAANLTVLAAGFSAHTGLDMAGMVFGLAYQHAAESLVKAAAAAVNACRCSGVTIQQGAVNYSNAEAASTLGGGAGVLQAPAAPVKIDAPGPPGTLGPGEPPPPLWAFVQSLLDDLWPDGDVAGLRAAAGRWRDFGAASAGMWGPLNASKTLVDGQQIPEGPKIDDALANLGTYLACIGQGCTKLATALDDFANEVDDAQRKIRDLLDRLGSLTDLAHDVVLIFEGDALDELRKIAEDIAGVQHNLGRQAQAFEQAIKVVTQLADDLVVKSERFMRGRFTHFLGDDVGNAVATVFDTVVNVNEGALKSALGMLQGIVELDPRRFLIDPEGAASTWKGMFRGSLADILLHPKEGSEASYQNVRALLHLDDWSTARPGLGFGENLFDVVSLFVPGVGEAGVVSDGAGAAARGAEAAEGAAERAGGRAADGLSGLAGGRGALADIAGPASGLTKNLEDLAQDLPNIEPASGAPVALPHGKPLEAPVSPRPGESAPATPGGPREPVPGPEGGPNNAAPRGVHETAHPPPGALNDGVPPPGGGPREPAPTSAPHESAPTAAPHALGDAPREPALVSATPVDRAPMRSPHLAESVPAHVPVAPGGAPIEPEPAASHASPPTPAPAAANVPAPHVLPSERPGELPPPGRGGHGSGDGDPPTGRRHGSPPHGGPRGPSDGEPPGGHVPHDGSPHEPGADGEHDGTTNLTPNDLSALSDYTGSGYQDLNDALRSNTLDASQHARVEALNNALDKLPAYRGAVIRGTDLPPEVLARYQPGEVITEDAFLSTTTNVAVARSPGFVGNVEFIILSNTGRDVSLYSMFPGEQEVLFRAGTSFYVVSKVLDPLTGKTIIRMIER